MLQLTVELRKSLLLVGLMAGALAWAICNWFIAPSYQSKAVIFPPNTHANIHLVAAGIRFGNDKEVGEHLEIMSSVEVQNEMIMRFDLAQRYQLDTSAIYFASNLVTAYTKNVHINRTLNKSLEIIVQDKSPEKAAEMANALVAVSDEFKSRLIKKNIQVAFDAAKQPFIKKQKLVAIMSDSLEVLRQAGEVVWAFGEERKSGRYKNYELQYLKELDRLGYLQEKFEELETLLFNPIPKSYVVSPAVAQPKPVAPKKLLISILASILAMGLLLGFKNIFSR